MSWVIMALGSAAVTAGINIVDKAILQNYVRTHSTLLIFIGLFQGSVGISLVASFLWLEHANAEAAIWALFSGSLFGLGGLFFIYVLSSQEVSRAVPISQSAPIFAAILGHLFLGESLNIIQWLAIAVTVLGASLLSTRRYDGSVGTSIHSSLPLLLLSSFLTAAGQVSGKVPLDTMSVPLTHGFRCIGLSTVLMTGSGFNSKARREVLDLLANRSLWLWLLAFSELVLVSVGFMLFLWAISQGQVGLVTAILASRSIFVLIYSTGLTLGIKNILGENVTLRAIAIKCISVMFIVVGVAAIAIY